MSSFDLTRIVDALQSSKTKSRNDALALLDGFSVPKLRLSSSQLAALMAALLKTTETERDAYAKNATNVTISRATIASGFLRDLVQESLKKNSKERPRLKTCVGLIDSIISLYHVPSSSQPFVPCTGNFARILLSLFEAPFVFTHLTTEAWSKSYHFLLRTTSNELEITDARSINENLLSDLLSGLYRLIGGPSTYGVHPLLREKTYFSILGLLTKTLARFQKRESPVLVTAFRIINNLLITLSTEDVGFSHQLIHIGIDSVLQFSSTSVSNLSEQIFIFLNLDPFHRYLSLEGLPKLVSVAAAVSEDNAAGITIYTLEQLIYALLQRLTSSSYGLNAEDIGLCDKSKDLDWYHLHSIFLKSKNSMPWLLTFAVAKLISSYYRVRGLSPLSTSESNLELTVAQRSFSGSFKRQKLQERRMTLNNTNSAIQFYNSWITEEDSKLQACGLQILLFHCELSEYGAMSKNQDHDYQRLASFDEPTVLDVDANPDFISPEVLAILSNTIKLAPDRNHSFWALMVCRSLLAQSSFDVGPERPRVSSQMHQLVKLSMDLAKDKSVGSLACSVFVNVINTQTPSSLRLLIDSTVMNQVENVAGLSEILGPCTIDSHAVKFWQTLAQIVVGLSSRKRSSLSQDIARWLEEKWVNISDKMTVHQMKETSVAITQIISWLGGLDTYPRFIQILQDPLYKATKECEELQTFIGLRDVFFKENHPNEIGPLKLEQSIQAVHGICDTICNDTFNVTEENSEHAVALSMALASISEGIRGDLPQLSYAIVERARNLLPMIRSKDQASIVLSAVLQLDVEEETLHLVGIPIEVLDYHFRYLPSAPDLTVDSETDLDSEFTKVRKKERNHYVSQSHNGISIDQNAYFQYLAKYDRPEIWLSYLNTLSPPSILECSLFYLDSGLLEKHKSNPVVATSLVRMIGEKLLSVPDFDRLDSTVEISCRLLEAVAMNKTVGDELRKDCLDLILYFFQCIEKDLLVSESARTLVWNVLLHFTEYNDQTTLSNANIISVLWGQFPRFSNRLKITVSKSVNGYLSRVDAAAQTLFSQKMMEAFGSPQASVESSATFCLFLTKLTKGILLDVPMLIHMMKYSRFAFFTPYLKKSIYSMAKEQGFEDSTFLFESLKLDLLKAWWSDGQTFADFPHDIFGYSHSHDFVCDNSKELTAVLFATTCKTDGRTVSSSFMDTVVEAKSTNTQALVHDSLATIIATAYTRHGLRGEVFASLKGILESNYKEYIRGMLPLIIGEVIRLTDVKSEVVLKAALGDGSKQFLQSTDVLRIHCHETIDPTSSVELISALIKTFWVGEVQEFWSLQIVYFLVRQIGVDAFSETPGITRGVLRKIQYILCLSRSDISDFSLTRLIASTCLPLIKRGCIAEAWTLLASIDFETCLEVSLDQSLPLILEILASLVSKVDDSSEMSDAVCQHMHRVLAADSAYFGSSEILIDSALNLAKGKPFEIHLADVETFLDDKRNASVISRSTKEIFAIVSRLVRSAKGMGGGTATVKLAAMCLKNLPGAEVDDSFRLWLSEYLAEYHLTGLAYTTLEDVIQIEESAGLDKEDFSSACKSLNFFTRYLLRRLDNSKYNEGAFLESAFGALIHEFRIEKRAVTKLLDLDNVNQHLGEYLLPIEPHSFALLNPNKGNSFCTSVSVDAFANDFDHLLIKLPFQDWTCQLLLSIIQEISRSTSIASILASCVTRMPTIAKDVLPNFVCFYVCLAGDRAVPNIAKIFGGYWKNFRKPFNPESIELIKNISISLRVGAMQNIEPLKKAYSVLDHKKLFMMVKESSSPKTALMFFEDSIMGQHENTDWAQYRESLSNLYGSLNDEDSLLGIPGDVTLESSLTLRHDFMPSSETLRYNSGFLDAAFVLNDSPSASKMITSLSKEGYLGTSILLSEHSETNSSAEWCWKLNQWDIPDDTVSSDVHDVTYSYFKQIRESPVGHNEIYQASMLRLVTGAPGSSRSRMCPRESLLATEEWLRGLALIKSVHSVFNSTPADFVEEMSKFDQKTKWFESAESRYYEDILVARRLAFTHFTDSAIARSTSLLGMLSGTENFCRQGEVHEIVRYNNLLRNGEMLQKTISSSILLEKLVNKMEPEDLELQQELQRISSYQTAQTLWAEGKSDVSVALLKKLVTKGDISFPVSTLNVSKMSITAQLAVWLAESRSDLGSNILERVVDPMKVQIDSVKDLRQRSQIYHLLANFCESQFKSKLLKEQLIQLETRVKSRKDEVQELKNHYGKSEVSISERNAARTYYNELKKSIESETNELLALKDSKSNFAHNAVTFYLNGLLVGEASDEDLDKFFSLFLELSGDEELQFAIKDKLLQLPSHKPLAWCTQILSRVTKDASDFQESIQRLIYRICHDHPFHSLYYLTSLLYHERLAKETSNASMISRVVAATHIRNKLHASSPIYAEKFLLPIERMCMECVSLAEVKCSKGRTLSLDKLKIGSFWLTELPSIPPPTFVPPVSIAGYGSIPAMIQTDPKVSIASSGISLPKIVTFMLSNGTKHKMLLKHGADDLRQDAIMEQVFSKVNKIFQADKETRKRKLRVRTYSAVPLGPKAGAIEFVPDSKALFEVIQPYHVAMDTMKFDKAREMMKDCQAKDLKERLRVYQTIEEKIRPVLRHYFLNNFVTPDSWFASRSIYIRGVATSSIVGHILGLGDRHCNNILLDEFTGEPIHIDLGVAFDQGKRLKIPETVPFRLTRDIVDGFGYMGTAGSFTKVSEHTFRVLRASRDHILAILDVLRWDPLYSWSISPIRKKKLQEENTDVLNPESKQDGSAAAKAILGVSEKLNAGGLSVEAAVRELIREATSEPNLAAIYCGWCPFY